MIRWLRLDTELSNFCSFPKVKLGFRPSDSNLQWLSPLHILLCSDVTTFFFTYKPVSEVCLREHSLNTRDTSTVLLSHHHALPYTDYCTAISGNRPVSKVTVPPPSCSRVSAHNSHLYWSHHHLMIVISIFRNPNFHFSCGLPDCHSF